MLSIAFALPPRTTYNRGQMLLCLALATDITPSARSELRWEVAGIALGFVLLSIGLAAMALFLFRRNAIVVLRCNVRVTSGRDCHLPLPFLSPKPSGSRKTHKGNGPAACIAAPASCPRSPGPSGCLCNEGTKPVQ